MALTGEGSDQFRLAALRAALQQELLDDIPLARAMQLTVHAYDGQRIHLRAPLAPNSNDKGCAFGGSLASLMTLAGWGLTRLQMQLHGRDAVDIYVRDSQVRYLAPIWTDIDVFAIPSMPGNMADAVGRLDRFGRVRSTMHCSIVLADGTPAATMEACYVTMPQAARANARS